MGVLAGIRRRYLDLLQPGRLAAAAPLQWHGAGPGAPPAVCHAGADLCPFTGTAFVQAFTTVVQNMSP